MNPINKVLSCLGIAHIIVATIHLIFGDIQWATFSTTAASLLFILSQQQEGE